jgi:hypothetical protein
MTLEIYAALALLVLIAVLLIVLLLRRPRVELPPEWPQRLQALEAAVQATQLAVAKNDGALDGMGQQLRGFTQATQATLDERLAQSAQESRTSRGELQAAFSALQARLEQHLAQARVDAAEARREQSELLAAFRAELTQTAQALTADSLKSRDAMADSTQPGALRGPHRRHARHARFAQGRPARPARRHVGRAQGPARRQHPPAHRPRCQPAAGRAGAARRAQRAPGRHPAGQRRQAGGDAPHGR